MNVSTPSLQVIMISQKPFRSKFSNKEIRFVKVSIKTLIFKIMLEKNNSHYGPKHLRLLREIRSFQEGPRILSQTKNALIRACFDAPGKKRHDLHI